MGAKNSFVAGTVLAGLAGLAGLAALASAGFASEPVIPDALKPNTAKQQAQWAQGDAEDAKKPALDRSGGKRYGKASFYANFFAGRKMADGKIMDPQTNSAASRTLPLGTTAKVTNLETGKSAVVTIRDRGPYVGGRIVDLSPATAQKIGITRREGIAKVEVTPIAVPMPDGRIKLGAAASDPLLAINLGNDKGTGGGW
jgi:rare lipoprotein A